MGWWRNALDATDPSGIRGTCGSTVQPSTIEGHFYFLVGKKKNKFNSKFKPEPLVVLMSREVMHLAVHEGLTKVAHLEVHEVASPRSRTLPVRNGSMAGHIPTSGQRLACCIPVLHAHALSRVSESPSAAGRCCCPLALSIDNTGQYSATLITFPFPLICIARFLKKEIPMD